LAKNSSIFGDTRPFSMRIGSTRADPIWAPQIWGSKICSWPDYKYIVNEP
jgi:hypothetical protein